MYKTEFAKIEDCKKLAKCFVEYLEEFKIFKNVNDYEKFLKNLISDKIIEILILKEDTQIIGFICYTKTYSPISLTYTILINDLYIINNKRKQGLGSMLIEKVEQTDENRFKKIMLNTDVNRTEITSMYLRRGYVLTHLTPMVKILN
jgi:predicted acetyltransferase